MPVGHHPQLAIRPQQARGGGDEIAAQGGIGGPAGMEWRVHHHRIQRTRRLKARRIGPVEPGARLADIFLRAGQGDAVGLDQIERFQPVILQQARRKIAPAGAEIGNMAPQVRRQVVGQQFGRRVDPVGREHAGRGHEPVDLLPRGRGPVGEGRRIGLEPEDAAMGFRQRPQQGHPFAHLAHHAVGAVGLGPVHDHRPIGHRGGPGDQGLGKLLGPRQENQSGGKAPRIRQGP